MNAPSFPNSAVIRALERLVLRGGRWAQIDIPVRYGIWLHPRFGPVLIDTGYSRRATEGGDRSRPLKMYAALMRAQLIEASAPLQQLHAMGFGPDDVTRIVVTHFHADHIAGLGDFPKASFVASGAAFDELSRMTSRQQLRHVFFPELLPTDFSERLLRVEDGGRVALPGGLGEGFDIFGDGSLCAVPLPGHAIGHFGLLWPQQSLLYAVDTQWLSQAIMERRAPSGPARLIYSDGAAAIASCEKVREFAMQGGRVVLCHDPTPLEAPHRSKT